MADKRVLDVAADYQEPSGPAGDRTIKRIKVQAKRLTTGRLERDVDRLLESKGLKLDEPVASGRGLRKASRAK